LENYKVSFRKNNSNTTKIYLYESPNSVIFLKLYLITKNQLFDLMRNIYGIELNISEDNFFKELQIAESSVKLDNSDEYDLVKCLGDLDNILIYSLVNTGMNSNNSGNNTNTSLKNFPISSPPTDYLRNIFIGLKKSFHPYSEYLIIYYIYRLEGIKNFYDINQLTECFFKITSKDPNNSNYTSTISSNTDSRLSNNEKNLMAISEEMENINNTNGNILNESNSPNLINTVNNTLNNTVNFNKDNETIKCSTCIASPFMGTPEKDQLNQYSYIFDLHHLPIFDENTGEFFWTSNEANWKSARDSILKSEELNGKSISLNHGSVYSLSTSFINNNIRVGNNSRDDETEKRWNDYRKERNSNTFINDLSNLLKNFENDM